MTNLKKFNLRFFFFFFSQYLMKNPIDAFLNGKPSISDYYALVLPTIAGLIPHHQYLRPQTQTHIIESLRLCSRHPRVCVHALTVALLEMPEIMLRHLPDILLEMSKMSTTLNVAVPVLEFLSSKLQENVGETNKKREYADTCAKMRHQNFLPNINGFG